MIGLDPTAVRAAVESRELEILGPIQFLKRLIARWL